MYIYIYISDELSINKNNLLFKKMRTPFTNTVANVFTNTYNIIVYIYICVA